jgi:glycosyltransferase involved in cell wall biosynthesis
MPADAFVLLKNKFYRMPIVSVQILTKNRAEFLKRALLSVAAQSFTDYEVVIVNDGSSDNTAAVIETFKHLNIKIIKHDSSIGITLSRQEALEQSTGEYVAILDDDDEWTDVDKLEKQVGFLNKYLDFVVVGGGIQVTGDKLQETSYKFRPQSDFKIRRTMLFRNNFFTSTVMFRRQAAMDAGGFKKDDIDLAEDYDLWLRMGKLGQMLNFPEVFTAYRAPSYNREKFKQFLRKQLNLISRHKSDYPFYFFSALILKARIFF